MTAPQLRMILVTAFACAAIVVACARRSTHVDTVPSHALGESTAPGPADPSAPAPDAAGVREVSSGPITGSTAGVPMAANPLTPPDIAPLAGDGGVTRAPADGGGSAAPGDAGRDAGLPRADAGIAPTTDGGSPTHP